MSLDSLGKIRLLARATGELEQAFRQAITNAGRARIDVQDIARAVQGLPGVTYVAVSINDTNEFDEDRRLQPGQVSVAVVGGDDDDIAETLRAYAVPGVSYFGNTYVTSTIDGYCRSVAIIRPIDVPVKLTIQVKLGKDNNDCPPPSLLAVRDGLISDWAGPKIMKHGDDVSMFRIRSAIESHWQNVEVISFTGERDGIVFSFNQTLPIDVTEKASFAPSDIIIEAV